MTTIASYVQKTLMQHLKKKHIMIVNVFQGKLLLVRQGN